MTMDNQPTLPIDVPEPDEPEPGDDEFVGPSEEELRRPEPPHPVNWNVLTSEEAVQEWFAVDAWVNWLRRSYGLPVTIIPPYWHRHPELVWELSALHLHWLGAYDPEQEGSAPVAWHADFAAARERLRDWTAMAGTKLDSDRPTRQTVWPGEKPAAVQEEVAIINREEDFAQFVKDDFAARRAAEEAFYANDDAPRTRGEP
jgi:homogentisate 1,2-dioxygenase